MFETGKRLQVQCALHRKECKNLTTPKDLSTLCGLYPAAVAECQSCTAQAKVANTCSAVSSPFFHYISIKYIVHTSEYLYKRSIIHTNRPVGVQCQDCEQNSISAITKYKAEYWVYVVRLLCIYNPGCHGPSPQFLFPAANNTQMQCLSGRIIQHVGPQAFLNSSHGQNAWV